jgi:hypothetical protein
LQINSRKGNSRDKEEDRGDEEEKEYETYLMFIV